MKQMLAVMAFAALALAASAGQVQGVNISLTVREWAGLARHNEPVTTGIPLGPGVVEDVSSLAVVDQEGNRVPAQFAALARWPDGSVRWLLSDFQASVGARGTARLAICGAEGAAAETPLRLEESEEEYVVTTGPLRFSVRKRGFDLLHRVWVDRDGDGEFGDDEVMASSDEDLGLVLLGPGGEGMFTSGRGEVTETAVEYQGPVRIGLRVRGRLRDASGEGELGYTARIEAFAEQSYVRTTVTLENPNPGGRLAGMEGNFWGLRGEGNVLFKEFALVERLHLDEWPYVQVGEEGRLRLERLPLLDQAYVYQDSSGGENWYHRNHVNRELRIPLRFRGYEVVHEGRRAARGERFSAWLDLADLRWGCAVGVRGFWENFPSALEARADGRLSAALWPRFFNDDHEMIAGEEKTHEVVWYFRAHPPYPRGVMGMLQQPLRAWAAPEVYLGSGEFGRHVPYDEETYSGFERVCAGAILSERRSFATDREEIDEYGWRNFGDVWALNERDKTGGPREGERVVSHFNLEYDEGWGMLLQAVRTVEARPELAREWWRYGREALLHEADIDIHHSSREAGEWGPWAGGMQTHTDHGVEAERSAHTGRPALNVYGTLRWPWGPGGGPESGHYNTRGLLAAYYLTGEGRFLDAAMDVTGNVLYRIENDDHPQIAVPDRTTGNNLQILTDAYLLTWDEGCRRAAEKAVEASHFRHSEWASERPESISYWQLAIYLKALGRWIEVVRGVDGEAPAEVVESYLGYARTMAHVAATRPPRGWDRPVGRSSDALMMAARFTDSAEEREQLIELAEKAFEEGWRHIIGDSKGYVYWNAKTTTIAFTSGGEWMYYQAHAADWLEAGLPR